MKLSLPILSVAALGLVSCRMSFADCTVTADREAHIDTAGVRRIVIDAGGGDLQITGRADAGTVEARGKACAGSARRLEDIQIFHEVRSEVLYLWTERDHGKEIRVGWVNDEARLDLSLQLPWRLPLEVQDGSGNASIKSVGRLDLEDGSGDLVLADLRGDAKIKDGSGGLDIVGVDGSVEVEDGSGEISITGVSGRILLSDGSGGVVIRQVGGAVEVAEDGSGDLEIVGAGQGVHVRVDGSGNILVRDVTGEVTVDEDGSGTIEATGITGELRVPANKRRKRS